MNKEQFELKGLAVIAQAQNGDLYEVALTSEMEQQLKHDLTLYFDGGIIKLRGKKLKSIVFNEIKP